MEWWKCFKIQCGDSCITLNILETIDFYASDGWISWYVNYILYKKENQKRQKKNLDPSLKKILKCLISHGKILNIIITQENAS